MGDTSILYRSGDTPVAIGTTFQKRVQDFSVDATYPHTYVDEMGRVLPVGLEADTQKFRGSLRWLPIDNSVEEALFGKSSPITLADMVGAAVVTMQSTMHGLTGARVQRLEYSFSATGESTATATLIASGESAGASIIIPAASGVAAYKGRDILVTVDVTPAVRAESARVTIDFTADEPEELGSSAPIGILMDTPRVNASINFYRSTAAAGNSILTLASTGDIVITFGTGAGKPMLTLNNMVSTGNSTRGAVRGRTTQAITYMSDVSTSVGFTLADSV